MDGFAQSVKTVLNRAKSGSLGGIRGSVAQIIAVEKGYETAVEIALGYGLQNIVAVSYTHLNINITPRIAYGSIQGDIAKLYKLIWERFTASQMADCVQETVSADIKSGRHLYLSLIHILQ